MGEERRKSVWPWIVALLIGLPVLYVLSVGPIAWFVQNNWRTEEGLRAINTVYSPIGTAALKWETVDHAIFKYLSMWVDPLDYVVSNFPERPRFGPRGTF